MFDGFIELETTLQEISRKTIIKLFNPDELQNTVEL
jgi:hypothetical protein